MLDFRNSIYIPGICLGSLRVTISRSRSSSLAAYNKWTRYRPGQVYEQITLITIYTDIRSYQRVLYVKALGVFTRLSYRLIHNYLLYFTKNADFVRAEIELTNRDNSNSELPPRAQRVRPSCRTLNYPEISMKPSSCDGLWFWGENLIGTEFLDTR